MEHLDPIARQGAHLILFNIGMEANRDTKNQKTAEDLLVLLAQHVLLKDKDFLSLVNEQLIDKQDYNKFVEKLTKYFVF